MGGEGFMSPKTELALREKIAALEERVLLLEEKATFHYFPPVSVVSAWPAETFPPTTTYTITSTGGVSNDYELKKPG